ncbi:acidic mammalian chitinase-like [Octopus sinensis]|uniref:Acidic mammalian chitinase-like n=1 Tax=Octopus sinensis TaxID=2607531 RepID=A0A6P7U7I3_9MOLL|nr:acidic mammalian chitinase-like [Octopus sinensis]
MPNIQDIYLTVKKLLFCYYTNWAKYRPGGFEFNDNDLANLCTHIIYAFCKIDANNLTLVSSDPKSDLPGGKFVAYILGKYNDYHRITSLKLLNPSLKVLLSVGGFHKMLNEFAFVSSNESNAEKFAKNIKIFLKKYNFDGFDINWEYPLDKKEAYTRLLKAVNKEFRKDLTTYILTAAVSVGMYTVQKSYEIKEISKLNIHIFTIRYLDYINLMTYHFYGISSNTVGHLTGLYGISDADKLNIDYVIRYWSKNGAPISKMLIGSPSYGHGFRTATKNPKLGDKTIEEFPAGPITKNSGVLAYIEAINSK